MGRLVGAALLALLLTQWTALTHAIAHAPLSADHVVAEDADGRWGHDAGTSTCNLIDHSLVGHAPVGDCAPVAWEPPEAALATAPKYRRVRSCTRPAYEARGPPRA